MTVLTLLYFTYVTLLMYLLHLNEGPRRRDGALHAHRRVGQHGVGRRRASARFLLYLRYLFSYSLTVVVAAPVPLL